MSDSRLNSIHLDLPRRQRYRRAREGLLESRGLLTQAIERMEDWVGGTTNWPSLLPFRPSQVLPGVRCQLVEQQKGDSYPLKTGLNTVGRYPENDIVFDEVTVSRRHCVVLVHVRGSCELHDTASRNGTFVNGSRIHQPTPLAIGDLIRICDRRLILAYAGNDEQVMDADFPRTALQ
jgi:hypothetical protein